MFGMLKKISIIALALLLISAYGFSLSWRDIIYTSGISTDYYAGEVHEIVYPDPGWQNNYLSELVWQIDTITVLKVHLGASLCNFSLNIAAGTAMNKGTGEMDDYDWGDSTITNWTNWSNSDIFLDKSFILDTSLTYSIKPAADFTIPVGIGYKLNYLNWSDKAGKFIYYGTWDSNNNFYYYDTVNYKPEAGVFGGTPGINYTIAQNIFFITTGISYTKDSMTALFNVSVSPYINAWDKDHHILRQLFFIDTFTSHFWYRADAAMNFNINKKSFLSISLKYEEMPETKGDTYYYNESTSDSSELGSYIGSIKSSAGLASKIFSISIGYTYQF